MDTHNSDVALAACILQATRAVMQQHPELKLVVPLLGGEPTSSGEELIQRMHDHLSLAAHSIPKAEWPKFVSEVQAVALQRGLDRVDRKLFTVRLDIWAKKTEVSYPGAGEA